MTTGLAVFDTTVQIDPGEITKLVHDLPASLRGFWPAACATV
jgi:uncharacterized protein (DUF2267 family)